ncbi:hypothetical protein PMIN02_004844 [Paraphaeosphaeria minitans]
MAADTTGIKIHVTSSNIALLVFGRRIYSEYLDFQKSIVLPRNSCVFKSEADWISARDTVQPVPSGHLPHILAYKAFMYWLHETGKLHTVHESPTTSLTIAKRCGHALHPAIASTEFKNAACPICTMGHAAAALSMAWSTWKILGAPDRRPPFDQGRLSAELYYMVKEIWRFEKKRWLSLVRHYGELERDVAAWEEKEPRKADASSVYTIDELREAKSVGEALQFARANDPHRTEDVEPPFVPHPPLNRPPHFRPYRSESTAREKSLGPLGEQSSASQLSLTSEPPSPPQSPSPSKLAHTQPASSRCESCSPCPSLVLSPPLSPVQVKKAVKFAVDVVECEARSGFAFKRTSVAYSPGRHASPSKLGWADTSFSTQKNFRYDNEPTDLELELQRLEAFFRRCREDTDSTLDDDSVGDTDSDTDSESDSDSDTDPGVEKGDIEDSLAEAVMQSFDMEVDPAGDIDHTTESDLERNPRNSTVPSGLEVQMLDSLKGLSDAELKSLLSMRGLSQVPRIASQSSHMIANVRPSGGTRIHANAADDGLDRGEGEGETHSVRTEATVNLEPTEDNAVPESDAPRHLSEMMSSLDDHSDSVSRVTEAAIDIADQGQESLPSPKTTLGRRLRTPSVSKDSEDVSPMPSKRNKTVHDVGD